MARKKSAIILPKLKDQGGDMSKQWYVEYSCRDPYTERMIRQRIYEGFNELLTPSERYSHAERLIQGIIKKFESGDFPFEKEKVTYKDELIYAQAAARYGIERKGTVSVRTYLSEFLRQKKASVNEKSYQTYRSKCRIFCEWLEAHGYIDKPLLHITHDIICQYLTHLAVDQKLSRLSIDKYAQIIRTFFDYLLKNKKCIHENPVHDIPRLGTVKDQAAKPIPKQPRKILMNAIALEDPQLFLVCQLEYYCAIRPNECRMLLVKDIDLENKVIRVRNEISKNKRTEIVNIPNQLYQYLIKHKINQWPNKDDYMFSKNGKPGKTPLGKNNFRSRFNKHRKRLGLPDDYKLYSLKHTGGVSLVQAGVDPWQLQQHFRHKSVTTTENYIKNRLGIRSDTIENHFPDLD